ncbi:MAG TPA: hypothetical protein VJZ01_08750 [Lachnospiraceae bacterium]|nr:hypothetical protein [Lachnospiraceae bacterium]
MWELEIFGVEFYYIVNWLIIYSVIGWIWESIYMSVLEKRLVNRGYVTGPVCTIYGVGALILYFSLRGVSDNYVLLFFCGAILATVLEYVTAVLMESIFHTSWWDYTNQMLNYKGRICFSSTVAWGVASILLFAVLQPFVNSIVALYPVSLGKIIVIACAIVYAIDFTFATIAAADLSKKLSRMNELMEEVSDYLRETRIYASTEDIRKRLEAFKQQYRGMSYFSKFSKRMEVRQAIFSSQLEQLGIPEHMNEIKERLSGFSERMNLIFKGNRFQQSRIMNAYPHLKTKAEISAARLRARFGKKKASAEENINQEDRNQKEDNEQ